MADKAAEQAIAPVESNVDSAAGQLSAMIDGELKDREVSLALQRLRQDSDLQGRWERYQLMGDVLQGHLPVALDTDFAARIRQAIKEEPLPQPSVKSLPAWYKPVTGFALAASVVMAVLFGLKLTQTDTTLPLSPAQIANASPPPAPTISSPLRTVSTGSPIKQRSEPIKAQLDSYLVNHNGYASRSSVNGMLPYVRMVGYQTDR